MKLSACITIYERPISVLDTVFASMKEQAHDEFIIVLDRTPPHLSEYVKTWWRSDQRTRFVDVLGEPGWRSPVKAWNRGYAQVTGDHLYCFSSETVQAAGNIEKAKKFLIDYPAAYFGKAECSCSPAPGEGEIDWGGKAPGNLFVDADHPRPLGFIWAGPMDNVRQIGGYDEGFSNGFWHDDTDFMLRLWRTGLDFVFDDSINGVHLHHERPVLFTQQGCDGIKINTDYMFEKHGTSEPWDNLHGRNLLLRLTESRPGRTTWRHL